MFLMRALPCAAKRGNVSMKNRIVTALPLFGVLAFAGQAQAAAAIIPEGTATLWISGGGVSGYIALTYDIVAGGPAPVVGISGEISDKALASRIRVSLALFRSTP
jgi:hypothetical protein